MVQLYSRDLEGGINTLESARRTSLVESSLCALLLSHQLFACGTWGDLRTHNSMQFYLSLLALFKQVLYLLHWKNLTISYYDYWYLFVIHPFYLGPWCSCKLRNEMSLDSKKIGNTIGLTFNFQGTQTQSFQSNDIIMKKILFLLK